jgi:SAM-dependent methyltransferase
MNHTEYIEQEAQRYLPQRYPRATAYEREKYAQDWRTKDKASAGIIADYQRRIGPVQGKKVLDVGSGIGGISIALGRAGAHPVGIEVEDELYAIGVENARLQGVHFDAVIYDGTKLPFEDNSFDGAVSVSVLEHTDDPALYLREIVRVLKPGASLYLAFPNRLWPKETHTGLYFVGWLPRFLADWYVKLRGRNPLEDNWLHFYSYWSLKRLLNLDSKDAAAEIVFEPGNSTSRIVSLFKKILPYIGIPSHRALLPHVSVIVKKK